MFFSHENYRSPEGMFAMLLQLGTFGTIDHKECTVEKWNDNTFIAASNGRSWISLMEKYLTGYIDNLHFGMESPLYINNKLFEKMGKPFLCKALIKHGYRQRLSWGSAKAFIHNGADNHL